MGSLKFLGREDARCFASDEEKARPVSIRKSQGCTKWCHGPTNVYSARLTRGPPFLISAPEVLNSAPTVLLYAVELFVSTLESLFGAPSVLFIVETRSGRGGFGMI